MNPEIRDLVVLSQYAADRPRFVQGGGGNCSVKFAGKMAIKASGFFLEDVSETAGFGVLELATGKPAAPDTPRVSMEAGLHQLLGTYVIHTHPVYGAAFVAAREGKKMFRVLFPEDTYQWIDYAAPGRALFEKVRSHLSKLPESLKSDLVLLLENHGLFVSSPNKNQCLEQHEKTILRLEAFLGKIPRTKLPVPSARQYLTPDHAVYFHLAENSKGPLSAKQMTAVEDIRRFAEEALGLMEQKHWHPAWLSPAEVARVLEMDDEKYRQQLWNPPG